MAEKVYRITAPDGKVYRVRGEGTKEEALAEFQTQWEAKNGGGAPAEDKRGFLERAKSDGVMSAVGDYAKGTYENMTDPQQWKDALWRGSHDSQGRNIGEQLMDPLAGPRAALDQAAIAGDDLSFGLYPRLTGQTDAVKEARERAGTAGTGMDMAVASAMPSRTAQAVAGPLTKAAGYGLEGAAYSGLRPVLEGADQRDVLSAMLQGGLLSSGASVGASLLPFGKVRDIPRRASYPDDASLFKESSRTPRTTVEGKDLATRTQKVKDLRIAATKGKPGLQELDKKQIDANTAAKGYGSKEPYPYEERLKVSEAAHGPQSKGFLGGAADFAGSALRAGGLPLSWLTKGASALGAAGLEKGVQAAMSKGGRRQVDEIADYIRNNGLGQMPTSVSPELANQLRDYVAKSMRTSGSKR